MKSVSVLGGGVGSQRYTANGSFICVRDESLQHSLK